MTSAESVLMLFFCSVKAKVPLPFLYLIDTNKHFSRHRMEKSRLEPAMEQHTSCVASKSGTTFRTMSSSQQ